MPYIDPITGAYVADSLEALPPGYNQPKAGNDANVAKMRAALNSGWDDNTPLPDLPQKQATDPFSLVKQAYQYMPGAAIPQASIAALSDMFGGTMGNLYGVGKQALSGQLGNPEAGNQAFADAQRLAQALHYNPPTQAGQDIYNAYNTIGEATGPLPELWNTRMRFTPNEFSVLGKTAIEDVRNFGSDYANAKAGVQREYPTAGSRAAQFTDVAGDLARPLAEKAYDMYMNPESSVEVYGMRPGANLSGLATVGGPMYAVKPSGGNTPLNMGSTNPLVEQGKLGRHLSETQISDPLQTFVKSIEKHYPPVKINANYGLMRDWKDFLDERVPKDASPDVRRQLETQLADEFANEFNAKLEPNETRLPTISDIERVAQPFNTWSMKPYQKYLTTQMGTGLLTDPYLQHANEANIPLNDLFKLLPESGNSELATDAAKRRERFLTNLQSDPNFDPTAPQNINVGKQTATTPGGVAMEDYLDKTLYPSKAMFMNKSMFPALSKIPEEALVTDFLTADPWNQTGLPAVRQKVFRDLVSGNVKPEDVTKLTPATVLKQIIDDYKKEQSSKENIQKAKDTWRAARFENIQSVIPYDDKSKMHVITSADVQTDAGKNLAMRDLGQSTIDLRQCIGAGCRNTADYPTPEYNHGPYIEPHTGKVAKGAQPYEETHIKRYMDRLEKGKAEIARLLDPNGVAQASVDLHYESPRTLRVSQQADAIAKWLENNNPQGLPEFESNVANFGIADAVINAYQLYPEVYRHIEKLNGRPTKYISEMKGYDNQEVKEKYVPHMVDWLNSMGNELTEVRDLKNLPEVHDLQRGFDAVGKISDQRSHWYSPTVEQFFNKVEDENLLPRFFTTDQFAQLATDHGVDLAAEPVRAEGEQPKYPKGATPFQMDMIDYYEPGAIRKSYGGYDRIISYNPETGEVVASEVKRDENGNWIDHPTYGGPRSHNTVPSPEEFRRDMGRPMRSTMRELGIEEQFANAVQAMEPEAPQQFQPARLNNTERDVILAHVDDIIGGNRGNLNLDQMVEPYATDMRILRGNQSNEARLPEQYHRDIIDALINQDDHAGTIRYIIDTLQGPGYFPAIPELTTPQLENILNMVISWTERYPLAE